jgi:hypothetical protein
MAEIHGPKIVTDSLVLALDAADKTSYPGTGTTWFDVSSRGNNATLYNGLTLSGGALVLDGTSDYILAPSCNTLGGLANQALEIWVKTPGLGSGQSIGGLICPDYGQISYIGSDGNIVYYLYSTDSGGAYLFSNSSTGVNMFDNKWHHVVCTRNESAHHIYIDGISRATGTGGGTWTGSTIWSGMNTQIGNNPNNVGYLFNGSIGLAKIYRKYLTQQEVLQNYNATKTRFGL